MRKPKLAEQDEGEKRQLRFLPEKMRQQRDKEDGMLGEEPAMQDAATERTVQSTSKNRWRGAKRKDSDFHEASSSHEELSTVTSKRRRRTTVPKEGPSRTLQRQSTMTQLADGRRPSISADEPEFNPTKRHSRTSWSGTGGRERGRDKKQRTLTQMIPGMGRLSKAELEELGDLDADLEDDNTNKDAVSQTLVEQGLLEIGVPTHMAASGQLSDDIKNDALQSGEAGQYGRPAMLHIRSSVAIQSGEVTIKDHDEKDYNPTQFIDAPTLKTRQTPRRAATEKPSKNVAEPVKPVKSRFSLLSTPEKRRIFEIPSSQSPAESVLSTQDSPGRSRRSALRERDLNASLVPETPSKRRQVTFEDSTIRSAPPALRKFESTIRDSEDEDESDFESDVASEDLLDFEGQVSRGDPVSAEAHNQDDLAYGDKAANTLPNSQASPEETEELIVRQGPYELSPELGESWAPVIFDDDGPEPASYQTSWRGAKSQSQLVQGWDRGLSKELRPKPDPITVLSQLDLTTQAAVLAENFSGTPPTVQQQLNEDLASTPMVIRDVSSDEEVAGSDPRPPHAVQRGVYGLPLTLIHQSTDLDGEPVQVPRSPSAGRETQQSHSSRAEQQLQNEWLSYSQYVHGSAPYSSSMHAAIDASSYNATPRPSKTVATSSPTRIQHSQATTVDEVTPKKKRTQRMISANTTPHKSSKSQSFITPEKPPSLFIPSSFPSPSRAALEGWSSPITSRAQNKYGSSQVMGSLEDFSIPLPPPPIEDD